MTVEEIIQSAVSAGLGLPRDPIQSDIVTEGVALYNRIGKQIYDMWPWVDKKVDQFNAESTAASAYVVSFASGIITFADTIDLILAVKGVANDTTNNDDTFFWPQAEVDAAINGVDISSSRWVLLSTNSSSQRRIRVEDANDSGTYRVLATLKFVEADEDGGATDYQTLEWPIDHVNDAIVAAVTDEYRVWDGQRRQDDWISMVQTAIQKVDKQQGRQHAAFPMLGDFEEIGEGAWY